MEKKEINNDAQSVWGKRIIKVYIVVLAVGLFLGLLAGRIIIEHGTLAADWIAIISWFFLFPAYIIADAIFNRSFVGTPLRGAALPLFQGFII